MCGVRVVRERESTSERESESERESARERERARARERERETSSERSRERERVCEREGTALCPPKPRLSEMAMVCRGTSLIRNSAQGYLAHNLQGYLAHKKQRQQGYLAHKKQGVRGRYQGGVVAAETEVVGDGRAHPIQFHRLFRG